MRKPAFPNKQFESQESYFAFTDQHGIYGGSAYELKKRLDKGKTIPIPRVPLSHLKTNDDFGKTKVTIRKDQLKASIENEAR